MAVGQIGRIGIGFELMAGMGPVMVKFLVQIDLKIDQEGYGYSIIIALMIN